MSVWETGFNYGALAGAFEGILGGNKEKEAHRRQREFAQNSIQWRVADAEKAGVHPLFALGAPPISYSPAYVGDSGPNVSQMGQDISRALMAQMDEQERSAAARMALQRHELDMERGRTEIELLRSQIARANSSQLGPGVPVAGATLPEGGPRAAYRQSQPIIGGVNQPQRQAGQITDMQYVRSSPTRLDIVPSEEMTDRMEDLLPAQFGWWMRNNIMPAIRGRHSAPPDERDFPPPAGMRWQWDGTGYRAVPRGQTPYRRPLRRRDRELGGR